MRSKTSFFNGTLFKKNLTRFAPVWILYTLCLLAGLALTYTNYTADYRIFWFAVNLAEDVTTALTVVNLLYALLVTQLLFGDLYNSRMCNALHAMPVRREGFIITNLVSGMCFSLLPTAVMTLVAFPLLSGSIVTGAWKIPFLVFAAANLSFACYFGIAVFSAMCVGNRFTMIAGYGLLNFGSTLAYYAVDMLYEPLMYGFITPTKPFSNFCPSERFLSGTFYDFTSYNELHDIMQVKKVPLSELSASFTLGPDWPQFFLWAGVGIALMAAAAFLYRKRHLECAGDAVAFRWLVPVFQVLCSLFVMLAAYYFFHAFFGRRHQGYQTYLVLGAGLIVGWFIAKMLVERSTRVFRLNALPGLAALGLAVVLTFVGTCFDVLGIESRIPEFSKVESVDVRALSGSRALTLTEEADIQSAFRFHELALKNRNESSGLYVKGYDGTYIQVIDTNHHLYDVTIEHPEFTYVTRVSLVYHLKNGNTIAREYNIWTEQEEGLIVRNLLSRWEALTPEYDHDGVMSSRLAMAMDSFRYLIVDDYYSGEDSAQINNIGEARSFLEAVKADCAAGTMIQDSFFHKSSFRSKEPVVENNEKYWATCSSIAVRIRGENYSWYVSVFPDCENTMRWLADRDLLRMDVLPNTDLEWQAITEAAKGDIVPAY